MSVLSLNRHQSPDYENLVIEIRLRVVSIVIFTLKNNGYNQDSAHFCNKHKYQIIEEDIKEDKF